MDIAVKLRGKRIAQKLNCESDSVEEEVKCLRNKEGYEFADFNFGPMVKVIGEENLIYRESSMPIVDGKNFLVSDVATLFRTGDFNRVPLMIGTTSNESTLFTFSEFWPLIDMQTVVNIISDTFPSDTASKLKELYTIARHPFHSLNQMITNSMFICPVRFVAQGASSYVPVYLYDFSHDPKAHKSRGLGARHALELPYVFKSPQPQDQFDELDFKLSDVMITFWTQFAHAQELAYIDGRRTEWPLYKADTGFLVMDLAERLNVEKDPHINTSHCHVWDEIAKDHLPVSYTKALQIAKENHPWLYSKINKSLIRVLGFAIQNTKLIGALALITVVLFGKFLIRKRFGTSRKVKKL